MIKITKEIQKGNQYLIARQNHQKGFLSDKVTQKIVTSAYFDLFSWTRTLRLFGYSDCLASLLVTFWVFRWTQFEGFRF